MGETVVMLRNSERSTYRRCRQRWIWNYVERRQPQKTKPALAFGTDIHKAMELRYPPGVTRGPHPAKSFVDIYEDRIAEDGTFAQWDEDGDRFDALELGTTMLNGYIEKYGKESHLQSLVPEMPFAIDIVDEDGNYVCTLVGTIDCVFYDKKKKRIVLRDYKTAKSIDYNLRPNSGYGEQGMTYWWAATLWLRHEGVLKKNQLINVLEFDFMRKGKPDDRAKNAQGHALNKDGTVSKRQPPPLFHRHPFVFDHEKLLQGVGRRVRMEAEEMAMVRRGELHVFKNPTKDCSWDCAYVDVCEAHELGGAWRDMLNLEFREWDPYDSQALIFEKA